MQWRRTNDLDLTVVAGQADVAAELEELGWIRHAHLEQRWLSPHAVNVDVLPASSDDIAEGKLRFAASGHVMNLAGFDLALAHNVPIELDNTTSLDVTTVPVIVVLKMDSSAEHTQFSRHFRGRTLVSKDELSAILVERLQAFRRGLEHANRFG